jgi:hypothetical protein
MHAQTPATQVEAKKELIEKNRLIGLTGILSAEIRLVLLKV